MAPPAEGWGSDGFGVPAANAPLQRERMFALVWPFNSQSTSDSDCLAQWDMLFHTVRTIKRPVVGLHPPFRVVPLRSILQAVRAQPAKWPVLETLDAVSQAAYMARAR